MRVGSEQPIYFVTIVGTSKCINLHHASYGMIPYDCDSDFADLIGALQVL